MSLTDIPAGQLATALREGEDASAAELLALVSSKDAKVRLSLAARPDAPLSALIHLAQDSKSGVRKALAANPALARVQTVVTMLCEDKDLDVLIAVAQNPAVPAAWVSALRDHPRRQVRDAAAARG